MSNKCTIYAEMHMVFDNDFDVYSITKKLGITPTECKMRNETRISPLTNKNNEGFWTIRTEEFKECDIRIVLDELIKKIINKLPEIKKICNENSGIVIFDIIPYFHRKSTPSLYFDRDFLNVVNYLNATIHVDLYVD